MLLSNAFHFSARRRVCFGQLRRRRRVCVLQHRAHLLHGDAMLFISRSRRCCRLGPIGGTNCCHLGGMLVAGLFERLVDRLLHRVLHGVL